MRITNNKSATDVAFARMHEHNTPANQAALEAARLRFRQAVEAEFGAIEHHRRVPHGAAEEPA